MNQVQIEVVSVPKDMPNQPEQGPRPPRMISPEFFSYTLSQVSSLTHNVILYGRGDPLLHPQFDDLMDACYTKDMKVHLVTDGLHMGEHRYLLNYPQLYELTFDLTNIDQVAGGLQASHGCDPGHLRDGGDAGLSALHDSLQRQQREQEAGDPFPDDGTGKALPSLSLSPSTKDSGSAATSLSACWMMK
jgi:hypothetical protein